MDRGVYTHGAWRVQSGKEQEFIDMWKSVGEIFMSLARPPGPGTLIQSMTDPQLFYSFGKWDGLEAVQEMRADARAQAGLKQLLDLCEEARPGTYRIVAESS